MRLIAHRGFAGSYPENTLRAVRLAAIEANAIEVDARRCGSGEIVAFHDETVDRVTDGTGEVAAYTAEELAGLSVFGTGEGVPTLAEVADAVPAGTGLVVELKESDIAADAIAAAANVEDKVICSFQPEALRECREVEPDVSLALNVVESTGIEQAVDLGCDAVHPRVEACSTEYVERGHEAGLAVTAWTVEDRATARAMDEAGVDGIMADSADVIG